MDTVEHVIHTQKDHTCLTRTLHKFYKSLVERFNERMFLHQIHNFLGKTRVQALVDIAQMVVQAPLTLAEALHHFNLLVGRLQVRSGPAHFVH